MIRAMRRNPKESQVKQWSTDMAKENPDLKFSLIDYWGVLARVPVINPEVAREELKEAFAVFDKEGKGIISAKELRHIVTSLGERLTDGEADAMMAVADPDGSGKVDVNRFITKLLAI